MQSFNVAGQGPFSVMIEDISSRNGLLPMSNVHPLRVTDLLQREDCCCYKREDLLKMKKKNKQRTTTSTTWSSKHLLALTIASCEDSESHSSSSARESHAFLSELLIMFTTTPQLSRSSPSHFRPQNLTWENILKFLCAVFLLFSPSPCSLCFLFFRAH